VLVEEPPDAGGEPPLALAEPLEHPVGDQRAGTGHRARAALQALRPLDVGDEVVHAAEEQPDDHGASFAPKSMSRGTTS
jgi:hypothetical protein